MNPLPPFIPGLDLIFPKYKALIPPTKIYAVNNLSGEMPYTKGKLLLRK
jgi:hypothetical protein